MLESKRRALIFIGLSVLLAALAGFLFLQKVKALNEQLGETTPVYIASDSIASRGLFLPTNVETMEMPNKYVEGAGFITDPDELANKVSVVPLAKGDIITKNMLKPVSAVTNENNRLISLVPSERVNFDQPLAALDRVDIVVSHKFSGAPKTEIFMKDVLVAMVTTGDKATEMRLISLEVPLQDAPRLIHMQNYADRVRVLKSNVGNGQQPKPAAPPAPATPAAPPAPAETPVTPAPATPPPAAPAPAQQPNP